MPDNTKALEYYSRLMDRWNMDNPDNPVDNPFDVDVPDWKTNPLTREEIMRKYQESVGILDNAKKTYEYYSRLKNRWERDNLRGPKVQRTKTNPRGL